LMALSSILLDALSGAASINLWSPCGAGTL
jgi:hypothetical protein